MSALQDEIRDYSERQAEAMELRLQEALIAVLSAKPKLISDVINDLRDKGWKRLNEENVTREIRKLGGHLMCRRHASGIAVYAATERFTEVTERRRYKIVPVEPY